MLTRAVLQGRGLKAGNKATKLDLQRALRASEVVKRLQATPEEDNPEEEVTNLDAGEGPDIGPELHEGHISIPGEEPNKRAENSVSEGQMEQARRLDGRAGLQDNVPQEAARRFSGLYSLWPLSATLLAPCGEAAMLLCPLLASTASQGPGGGIPVLLCSSWGPA
ncbi:hypothetical protein NDU88_003813 [Pleurodeles waltl]|uniref:Uncharacterized protein n=1 Tax=Pleurodeles waltl TaxID=8319 RepID=A0AAV7M4G8_PLEWA|nr:hypothetical protein NDU88_003813 [Pleurodeles waltl]